MTAMTEIIDMLPDVMVFVPAAAEPVMVNYIRDAAREICEAGKLWRETHQFDITTPAFQGVIASADATIISFRDCYFEGQELAAITVDELDNRHPNWKDDVVEATPRYVTQLSQNSLTVYPRSTGTLRTRLTLKPSRRAEEIPAFLEDRYGTAICRAAAGRLMLLPGENSNPTFGATLVQEWTALLDTLRTGQRDQIDSRYRTKGSYF